MIEILDKINNTYEKVSEDIDMVIHPLNKETTFLKDCNLEGHKITGVIFKEDGTTMILYKNITREV
ncbi:hypothetical protein LCGC14_1909740 [marine sediment metagenome]|uniref:Uncharacterized protein n=1 Tax=marine sediment metagenome TaxID=412755 RepID=A0A0F9GHA9_9ZZZZ